jgi:hypothetical protein
MLKLWILNELQAKCLLNLLTLEHDFLLPIHVKSEIKQPKDTLEIPHPSFAYYLKDP